MGGTWPIVINNNNVAKATPTLLSFYDVRTLFHEFGHGLHGLLSMARFERLAGTRVLRDYVELPSKLFENWAEEAEVLTRHARHHVTGEVIPDDLLAKLSAARLFDQAWEAVQYIGPALIDMALHSLPNGTPVDIAELEAAQNRLLGVPPDIGQRHHLSHFQRLFSGPAMPQGTASTCGLRCWRPMALVRSPRPATRLIPSLPSACCATRTVPATPGSLQRRSGRFAAATRKWHPCSGSGAGCWRRLEGCVRD